MLSSFCQHAWLVTEGLSPSFPQALTLGSSGLHPCPSPLHHKGSTVLVFFCTRLLYTNHILVWPPELKGVGAQATSISPSRYWWESSLHGEQVKTLHQNSKSSRREAVRERGRSEGVQVRIGSELHLEVGIQALLFCRCSHLSLKPLLLSAYTLNTAKS